MTEREIENQIKVKENTLALIQLYPDSFHSVLGIRGTEMLVDRLLDEIIYLRKERNKIKRKMKKIDVQSAINNLKSFSGKELAEAIEKGNFSSESLNSIDDGIDDLFIQACKTKLSLNLRELHKEQPNMALKDVVATMLNLLPKETKESEISTLTNFIMENWKNYTQKKAA